MDHEVNDIQDQEPMRLKKRVNKKSKQGKAREEPKMSLRGAQVQCKRAQRVRESPGEAKRSPSEPNGRDLEIPSEKPRSQDEDLNSRGSSLVQLQPD